MRHKRTVRCPKCSQDTWMMNVYVHITAPAEMNHRFSKKNMRDACVKFAAVLWETTSFWCSNSKCGHWVDGPRRMRLDDIAKTF